MHDPNQKIQFFNSQSSFGSSSNLPQSKYYDFTNELIAEIQNIFTTLKQYLEPNEKQSHRDKIEYSLKRAQVLQKDTIPEHIAYLNRIQAPKNAKEQVLKCKEKLTKLLGDYDRLKNGTMIYKQFYNIYGKDNSKVSSIVNEKKEISVNQSQALIKQEYVQVNSTSERHRLKAATPRVFAKPEHHHNDKEIAALKEEVFILKKTIQENRKRYEIQLLSQKLMFQKRIRTYLSIDLNVEENQQKALKDELKQYSDKLSIQLQQNIKLQQTVGMLHKEIKALQNENQINKEQNNLLLNIEAIHNELKQNDHFITSFQDRKYEKLMKNVMQENQLLLSQIKHQRKRFYQIQNNLSEQQRRQCERNKKHLQKKKAQLEELYLNFDKQRIQMVQLSHSNRSHSKIVQQLKRQNEQLKQNSYKPMSQHENHPLSILSFSIKQHHLPKVTPKLIVQKYDGEGIEGYPYYQMLSKQFKIRFRRACLKQKQLLHKGNGIEIGVITKFNAPNTIHMFVHLTNCSEEKLSKLKIKIMNTNENRIDGEYYEYGSLSANEQIKIPVSITINQYPIGPVIFLLQYEAEKKEQIRILLPAHIIKTMEINQRQTDIDLQKCSKCLIVSERKICKDINDLKQFFAIGKIIDQKIKLNVFHQHTHTLIQVDLMQTKDGLQVLCNHLQGTREISEYFIKTFIFLIKKQPLN